MNLEKLLNNLNGVDPAINQAFLEFDQEVLKLKTELNNNIQVDTVKEVNSKLAEFKAQINIGELTSAVDKFKELLVTQVLKLQGQLDDKTTEIKKVSGNTTIVEANLNNLYNQQEQVKIQIITLIKSNSDEISKLRQDYLIAVSNASKLSEAKFLTVETRLSKTETELLEDRQVAYEFTLETEKNIKNLRERFSQLGGGSMNRKETFGGTDYLTRYTDINWKAGTNVTFTVANNDQTKQVDITLSATGDGGIVRSINSISTNTNAGGVAATDYVYLCTGTLTLTLPTAVASTNLYTVKNVGTGVVTVAFSGGQTGDGQATLVMPVQYTSIDLISDTANYNIT